MTSSAMAILQAEIAEQESRLKDVEAATREEREAGQRAMRLWEAEKRKLAELREGLDDLQRAALARDERRTSA